jgi:predicted GNAT family N-acyltransferase
LKASLVKLTPLHNPLKNLDILLVDWVKASKEAFFIRKTVFIDEQRVPEELELDADDLQAIHVLAKIDGLSVGTARLVAISKDQAQIGRMAVLDQYRGQGIGRQILEKLIQFAQEKDFTGLFLHSQVNAIPFYEKMGFKADGDIYDEAGIPHRNMMLVLPKSPNHP